MNQDYGLDALAMLTAALHEDDDGLVTLLYATDDVDHWRCVAIVLNSLLSGIVRVQPDYEHYLVWQRERILSGKVGQPPDELGGEQ